DVGIKIFPSGISPVAVIAKVLTKKKKYAAILTRNIFIFRILRVFGFLRGTEVFLIKEKSGLSDRKNVIHMGDIPFLPRKLREI
ncbi:MAG: hypothetical protein KKG84_05555, partial [Candidatus Omnitrophica bacterium]|nr:hypothetical protein [Candidatus Omnitrophota bacterium]